MFIKNNQGAFCTHPFLIILYIHANPLLTADFVCHTITMLKYIVRNVRIAI